MVIAALRTITWGTIAGAVVSAVLLAVGGLPRGMEESLRARPAAVAQPARAAMPDAVAGNDAQHRAAPQQGSAAP